MSSHVTVQIPVDVISREGTKSHNMEPSRRNLVICSLGIFVCYFYYGILQEKITRGKYMVGEKTERFTYTLSLVCVQCIINLLFAKCIIYLSAGSSDAERDNTPKKMYATCAVTYLCAMLASNHALQHVNYPTQVVGKSIKPIPVMILGVLLARKKYPLQKYMFVLMIVVGVALFIYKESKGTSKSSGQSILGIGEMLLLLSLALDGFTGGIQDRIRANYRTHAHTMMLYMNFFSALLLMTGVLVTGEVFNFVAFVSRHPTILIHMLSFSVASALGQNFIFLTVANFGPLACSITTTTRKFFTVLGSVVIFGNVLAGRQWVGTGLVFSGLILDNLYGKEQKTVRPC
ncbi:solute carrier family 35 member B1-like [Lineus longissimus]|uniref:solute carrier family 35 member B1-like n=1 Tax=Lineus longissimus TaxID=88925 RepID=UPI00315DDF82